MYQPPTPLDRVLAAVNGAHWVRWDQRTRRLFVWQPATTYVNVYDHTGTETEKWPVPVDMPPGPWTADVTVSERLGAGY